MLETDDDLETLVRRKDHLNVLRYLRVHQIRDPALVVSTGRAWLGDDLRRTPQPLHERIVLHLTGRSGSVVDDEVARLAALEQICLAALEVSMPELAQLCLKRLEEAGVAVPSATEVSITRVADTTTESTTTTTTTETLPAEGEADPKASDTAISTTTTSSANTSSSTTTGSTRFRLLQGRCLEAAEDYAGADLLYDELLQENPANLMALKRKYCIRKAQQLLLQQDTNDKKSSAAAAYAAVMESLNQYLEQNPADTAAWYELAHLRQELGDYQGAAFCLEEVVLAVPADAKIHVELAECLATAAAPSSASGSSSGAAGPSPAERLEILHRARLHMAQALELDPHNRRAQFGLVSVANSYLIVAAAASNSTVEEHDLAVAQELVRFGAEHVLEAYKGSPLLEQVQTLMAEYTEDLS